MNSLTRWALRGLLVVAAVIAGLVTYQQLAGSTGGTRSYGAPFELVNATTGDAITEAAFRGQPTALFFGFTHCPEVCPTTLFEMQGWLAALGDEGKDVKAYFVSIDPERDTAQILKDYVGNVSDRVTGITGEPDKVAAMAKSYGIFVRKVPLEGDDYTMDHTASVLLLDRDGDFFGTIAYEENAETAVAKLRRLINEG